MMVAVGSARRKASSAAAFVLQLRQAIS
jgi:hypothetical protein